MPTHIPFDMSTKSDKITEPVAKLFQDKNFSFVSTLMKDGSPQITPTWVDIEENGEHNILINTAEGRIKHKNLSRDPRLAISVMNRNNPYEMVTIRGKVIEQIRLNAAEEHINKLAKKYLDVDKYPGRSPGEKRVILKVKPEKIFYQPPIR
jgi:PPOX class probable F420-dependent enzyme